MTDKPLSRCYRYDRHRDPNRVVLKPSPVRGEEAVRFCAETHRIANLAFKAGKSGLALNAVCTAQGGGVVFQHRDQAVNRYRARLVAAVWRVWRWYHVKGCQCTIAAVLPDGTMFPGGVDDCPVHGFGGRT